MQSPLPVSVATFVGREHERAAVTGLISDARVVTLVGSGGCGKTRLAMEVAADVAPRFSDGASWVDLQRVSEPAMVPAAVGAAVGVRERSGEALTDTLVEQLRERDQLVVLDNCEHLVTACAALVSELSHACPRLHVLATSRMPLAVAGEATLEVAPLPVPGPDAWSVSAVAVTDAARLFEVRARQVRTDLRIDDKNSSAVAEICRRLDGIPLAIELAAARMRVLSPGQIAAGLSDRFRLLTRGAQGAPARQHTLEASLDWSYDLLDDSQRLALARLSVFAGSFELDAAEAVVAGDGINSDDVLDLVAALAEQSLLQVTEFDTKARYRLLETIRVYARQRLAELDDPARVRDRHLEFYVGLAGRAQEGLRSEEPEPWMARLAADLDDLRAAMDWTVESGDLRGLVGITEPILRFWWSRGLSREVHQRLHAVVEDPDSSADDRTRGSWTAMSLAYVGGQVARAHRSASEAVAAARTADAGCGLPLALAGRALAGARSGHSTNHQLQADVDEAVELSGGCQEDSTRAYLLATVADAVLFCGTIDAGIRLHEQTLEVCEANKLVFQLPSVYAGLGWWLVRSGRPDRGRSHARRAVDLARQVGRPVFEACGFAGLGAAATLEGDHDEAHDMLSQARGIMRRHDSEGSIFDLNIRSIVGESSYASGDLGTAREVAESQVRIARGGGSRWDEAWGEWLLGVVAYVEGRHADARAHWEAGRRLSTDPRMPLPLGRSLLGLAQLARQDEDVDVGWELAHGSLEILDDYCDRVFSAAALETIADLAAALGEPDRSLRLLAASERFHADTGIARFPLEATRFDRVRDAARAALEDPDEAAACWDAGSDLSLEDAVAYARRGRGQRQRPKIGWASLTPAERDVVGLVAQGHTNAEIAERLFISVHTVKTHLSRVYAKVDVDGRAGLAAQATRRDL